MTEPLAPHLRNTLAGGEPCILVCVAATRGSTPREAGATMLVTVGGSAGTIGGGRLELDAIAAARTMIGSGEIERRLDIPLGPATGQCCGGHVVLRLARATAEIADDLEAREAAARAADPALYLFGAGHVGRALAYALAPLPFRIRWIDQRAEEFPAVIPARAEVIVTDHPLDRVADASPGSGFLVMTHSHALDFDLVEAILQRGDAFYVGLIGSATKRLRFERRYRARGGDPADLDHLTCPIGAGLRDEKRPELIAAMTAAELLLATQTRITRSALQAERVPLPRSAAGCVYL